MIRQLKYKILKLYHTVYQVGGNIPRGNSFTRTLDCRKSHSRSPLEGSRDGAVVRALAFHQCGPGSMPGLDVICGLSLLLVLFSAPRGFSSGTPVFPSPQKPTFLNSNSIRNARAFRYMSPWLGRLGNHSSRYRA